jgi:hypothetical protein
MLNRSELGVLGEKIVAALYGFERQPASGSRWPYKEDLIRFGHGKSLKELAQVKTSKSSEFIEKWDKLDKHAKAEEATSRWFQVYVTPDQRALVFEIVKLDEVDLGIGGDLR